MDFRMAVRNASVSIYCDLAEFLLPFSGMSCTLATLTLESTRIRVAAILFATALVYMQHSNDMQHVSVTCADLMTCLTRSGLRARQRNGHSKAQQNNATRIYT
ncbi:unnamed protein product, partial [Ceratitis capitata]